MSADKRTPEELAADWDEDDEPDRWDKETYEDCPACGAELWFDTLRKVYECPEGEEVYRCTDKGMERIVS
jgi:predicted RNA-binding Zn-ribbon protein involved in translation (DUF1610 family)